MVGAVTVQSLRLPAYGALEVAGWPLAGRAGGIGEKAPEQFCSRGKSMRS